MSRAMNLTLAEADVKEHCRKAGVTISAIEPLPAGGTRLICTTAPGAEEMRTRLGDHLIDGAVARHRFYRPPGAQGGY
jgi:hypothetical protein